MSIFEYDEEKHLKNEREYAYRQGKEQGEQIGRMEGKKEGKLEGKKEGRIEGIRILITTCLKEKVSRERIL